MIEKSIKENINNPEELEKLYQDDSKTFEKCFSDIYPEISETNLAQFWKIRIDYTKPKEQKYSIRRADIFAVIFACFVAGFLIKIPGFFNINVEDFFFYEKNAGLIVLMGLSLYAILTKKVFKKQIIISIIAFIIPAIYINLLPSNRESQSINLAYIHLPLLVWCIYGLIHMNFDISSKSKRIDFIKYNGDLAILSALILIAGMLLAGVTIGLFSAIDIKIEQFYMEYVAVWGVVSTPIIASFIMRHYPFVTNKIAPIIAHIFSPLVLITLIVYLVSIPIAAKDPYNDREFLLIFNLMLIGVMGIIVFSISESSAKKQKTNELILFLLVVVTLLIDIVALSAILYRLSEYGFTPNRTAVLVSNVLIFSNLIHIMIDLYKVNFRNTKIMQVETTIARYLPIYALWALIVVFGFPLLFSML